MTQLIIAGTEVALPQQFSVTVKRENPFFTKSGEYTYDCQLRLDNPVNQQLYGFVNRLNRTAQVATGRTAILMADGHVYCRGTEVITKWTNDTVTIQIVSGESELNFVIGQDRKIEDLDLGEIAHTVSERSGFVDFRSGGVYPDADYCCPTVRVSDNYTFNSIGIAREGNSCPQPYLCALIVRILQALGYNQNRTMVNGLANTVMKNIFIVNTLRTTEYAKLLPGWTVKDFLSAVERLTGAVFVTNNEDPDNPICDLVLKQTFYLNARQLPLRDVVDTYETEIIDDGGDEEFTASNVSYQIPDHEWAKLMKLPEGVLESATVEEFDYMYELMTIAQTEGANKKIYKNSSTDRLYILRVVENETTQGTETYKYWVEVDQFCDLKRQDASSTMEIEITPAPIAFVRADGLEIVDVSSTAVSQTSTSDDSDTDVDIEETIKGFEQTEAQAKSLYCAFCDGTPIVSSSDLNAGVLAYTDAYHAATQADMHTNESRYSYSYENLSGSLRLQDLDSEYYNGTYQIDTSHAVTFETFDPNVIDVRQVYVVNNKRYVVRDCEEVITAEGRQPLWRLTCYPITISDEAIANGWILTHGVWDDGAAWLDDGRWTDSPSQ